MDALALQVPGPDPPAHLLHLGQLVCLDLAIPEALLFARKRLGQEV
jgi:hypothetical protein